ncbi:hypothetical protein [Thalassotalea sp. ND16A]|uniref:hypothetical protein n=1 Tax=Thalassotalea sp. ND16A TaxID=1535422 RepID=UPI00051D18A6|nr:hypothetical protein [Thalassotalea sp. ND16A]KGJ88116.1 hypothetical protein ND16A_2669 [Thalassotalea sp. ND16A]
MSFKHNGKIYSIKSPVQSISVNKHNIVVTDQKCSQLFSFNTVNETKCFLARLVNG